ncbi:response regulator with CheY-like receiver domain and winged-helix DNA-binding domain [Natronococcus occultus SP4]|uniref:Response regulator with CheY-like receiver domain and winged-helix DNA-binding domain n=2 Tax=Natronococcus occultus TaxID=29288 RepID=L0K265_9EURY|nr:response regulator with CheY-like receiver domain and winged-helix DNA-binding domain [Natronococcus occultus SP4]
MGEAVPARHMSDGAGGLPASLEILLVEDNPGDVRLTKEALRMTPIDHTLHVVNDGSDALDFLHRRAEFVDAPRPDLVLLDFKLPRLNGDEVATEIEGTELEAIPLVVLTGHPAQDRVLGLDELPVDDALTKPVDADGLLETLRSLETSWSGIELEAEPGPEADSGSEPAS